MNAVTLTPTGVTRDTAIQVSLGMTRAPYTCGESLRPGMLVMLEEGLAVARSDDCLDGILVVDTDGDALHIYGPGDTAHVLEARTEQQFRVCVDQRQNIRPGRPLWPDIEGSVVRQRVPRLDPLFTALERVRTRNGQYALVTCEQIKMPFMRDMGRPKGRGGLGRWKRP